MRDDVDHDFDLDGPVGRVGPPARRMSVWTGAILSLVLAGGAAAWLWTLGTQDPRAIPVIAAMSEPVKTRPPTDAAALTPHRDAQSYELATGGDETTETTLAPPPARPGEQDPTLAEMEASLGAAAPDTGASPTTDPSGGQDAAAPRPEAEGPTPPAGTGSDLAPASGPLVRARPQYLARRMRAASEEAVADAVALARRAATSPWQIQLGAFRDPRLTREQWQLISGTHDALLDGRALAVQETVSGGETFYRLRVGPFASETEAADLCRTLEARGQTCITAENR